MIIQDDSVLRSIPKSLNNKRAFFIEAIRISIEMVDVAHRRLQMVLLHVSQQTVSKTLPDSVVYASALLDAWSIIDSIHRLRGLVEHFPKITKRMQIPAIRYFCQNSKQVEVFR